MPSRIRSKHNYYSKLESLIKVLREECPWDREQTLTSLRNYTLEEVHEVLEAVDLAIERKQWQPLRQELGDLLFHILFYAKIADEHQAFNLDDVVETLIEKMVYRHPHVFTPSNKDDLSHENLSLQWEKLKDSEHSERNSLMDGIPPLPALAMAHKMQRRASRVGFDWTQAVDVLAKMREELAELEAEVISDSDLTRVQDEFGDVLFTLVNLGRKLGVDAELALLHTNRKFAARFRSMESLATESGLDMAEMELDALEELYAEAKSLSG